MNNTEILTKDSSVLQTRDTNEVKIFSNSEFGKIRTVTINNEPWFVGKDVCETFGDTNHKRSLSRIDEDEKGVSQIDTPGGKQNMTVINESGLYSLLFQMQPQKAKGVSQNDNLIEERIQKLKRFKRWVTSEVLPTIRKTGGYVNSDELFINTYLPFAEESTKVLFLQTLHTVREQNAIIQRQNLEIKEQKEEIIHKEDVIIGLVGDIDLATKRQRITQIVRHCKNRNYQDRYRLLYSEFERKYHCNLKLRMENDKLKPKAKNTMDYIDRGMNMIPELYEIACKLFENDVEELKAEWDYIVA